MQNDDFSDRPIKGILGFAFFLYDTVALAALLTCVLRSLYRGISALPLEWAFLPFFAAFAIPFSLFVGGKIGKKIWV